MMRIHLLCLLLLVFTASITIAPVNAQMVVNGKSELTSKGINPIVPTIFSEEPVMWNSVTAHNKNASIRGGIGVTHALNDEGVHASGLGFFSMNHQSRYCKIEGIINLNEREVTTKTSVVKELENITPRVSVAAITGQNRTNPLEAISMFAEIGVSKKLPISQYVNIISDFSVSKSLENLTIVRFKLGAETSILPLTIGFDAVDRREIEEVDISFNISMSITL